MKKAEGDDSFRFFVRARLKGGGICAIIKTERQAGGDERRFALRLMSGFGRKSDYKINGGFDDMSRLGETIRAARLKKGLTPKALGKK